ncbi:MAG: serine hydrolase [Candidatus Colwellbacteria bacterium]|nr:serine hydrolase [Candidatus Colwellbacteria bacterium]
MNKRNVRKGAFFAIFLILAGAGIHFAIASLVPEKPREISLADISSSIPDTGSFIAPSEIPEKRSEMSAPKDLAVESSMAFDLSTGSEIFSVDKNKRWPIASITKMMTSVIALENLKDDAEATMSENAIATEGSSGGMIKGDKYTVHDLITAMMVVSSNDAAVAISEMMPEGEFIKKMNEKAKALGMANTNYVEPTGLSSMNQSTMEDMSKLMIYAWVNHQELFVISSKTKGYIKEVSAKKKRELTNIDVLSSRSNFLGGKTGFTEEARQNLISVFSFDKRPVGIMIFGAEDRVVEADKMIKFIKDGNRSN